MRQNRASVCLYMSNSKEHTKTESICSSNTLYTESPLLQMSNSARNKGEGGVHRSWLHRIVGNAINIGNLKKILQVWFVGIWNFNHKNYCLFGKRKWMKFECVFHFPPFHLDGLDIVCLMERREKSHLTEMSSESYALDSANCVPYLWISFIVRCIVHGFSCSIRLAVKYNNR